MRRDLLLPILLFSFSYSLVGQADDDFRIVHTFEDNPATNSYPVVFGPSVGGDDGSIPSGPVAIDPKGNLYGTTRLGGNSENYGYGTLFELTFQTNTGWSETILHGFTNGDDGQLPNGGATLKLNGSHRGIYGSAAGGAAGYGVDYEFRAF